MEKFYSPGYLYIAGQAEKGIVKFAEIMHPYVWEIDEEKQKEIDRLNEREMRLRYY